MSIEAPLSKYKKHNMLIMMAAFIVFAVIFGYDGYLSKYEWSKRYDFYKKHVLNNNGVPDSDMKINQYGAIVLLAIGLYNGFRYWSSKDKKIVADNNGLICEKLTISYDRIDSIDKTFFDKKGYFIVHYRDGQDQVQQVQISDRQYDNIPAVLDHLVSKLTS